MQRSVRPWEVLNEENVRRLFGWLDADGDGVVSVLEFTSLTSGSNGGNHKRNKGKSKSTCTATSVLTAAGGSMRDVMHDTRVTSATTTLAGKGGAGDSHVHEHARIPGAKMELSDFERMHLF